MHSPVRTTSGVAILIGWTGLIAALGGVPRAVADDLRDLLEEALDQNVQQVRIEDQPLRDALAQLEQATGVRFTIDEDVIGLMPYGPRTRVSLVIEDLPLRQGLRQLFDGLGLNMQVEGDHVRVLPAPVLDRIGRRMTVQEVGLLGLLASGQWAALDHARLPLRYMLDDRSQPPDALDDMLTQVRAPNALRALEEATQALGWVWQPDGDTLVIRTQRADVEQRLDRPLDMTYQRVALDDLLVDLGRRVGVTMFFEPGALQRVAARDSTVDIIQRGVRVRQILELIGGRTGLQYQVDADGVHFAGPADAEPATRTAPKSGRLFRITIPLDGAGGAIDAIVREDELPPEVRALFEAKFEVWLADMVRAAEAQPPH